MDKVWEDYLAQRPGTIGGDMGIKEAETYRQMAASAQRVGTVQEEPAAAAPRASNAARTPSPPRAPRAPYRFKGSDLAVAVVVFVTTWLVLWRASNMGGGTAAAAGFFAGCVAARFWRPMLVLTVIGLGLAVYFHRH